MPSEEGQGTQFIIALFYDHAKDQCQPFLYKGEGGNANRFVNERECIRNCSVNADTIYPMDGKTMSWIYGDGGLIHVFETGWNVQNVSLQKKKQTLIVYKASL